MINVGDAMGTWGTWGPCSPKKHGLQVQGFVKFTEISLILNEFFEMEIYLKIGKSYLLPMNVKSVLRDLISHRTSLQTPSYC